jgi:hypothetical protein
MMSALTLTWVFASIFPGARTREVMSSTRTRASCTASTLPALLRRTFAATTATITTTARPIHNHFLLFT